jgi:hypothetical protein
MPRGVWLVVGIVALTGCNKNNAPGGNTGVAGTGVAGTGVAGTGFAGTGFAGTGVAGTGVAGTGASVPGCEAADPSVTGSALHAGAADVLAAASPCGFSACHMGASHAKLMLAGVADLHAALVGKPSCEAPTIPLIDSKGGNAGLQNSWLWLKLTSPADPSGGNLIVQSSWPTPGACGQMSGFGSRMPMTGSADLLEAPRLAEIRNWICAGAPGP